MKTLIQIITVSAISVLFTTTVLAAADDAKDVRDRNASEVAKAWFISLMQGNTAVTTSLSEVPFALDRKQEIKTLSELKIIYDKLVTDKGKRNLIPSSIEIKSSSPEKVEVVLKIEDEAVVVFVRPGDAYRIIGFWD
jgi:hypothetical protein